MTNNQNIKVDAIGLAAEVVDLLRELEQQATLLGKGSEREARLLAEKARLENYIAKQLHQLEVENTGQEVKIEQLEAENADLRADKERLDWLLNRGVAWRDCYDGYWSPGEWLYMRQDGRGTIDAAMKEGTQ